MNRQLNWDTSFQWRVCVMKTLLRLSHTHTHTHTGFLLLSQQLEANLPFFFSPFVITCHSSFSFFLHQSRYRFHSESLVRSYRFGLH